MLSGILRQIRKHLGYFMGNDEQLQKSTKQAGEQWIPAVLERFSSNIFTDGCHLMGKLERRLDVSQDIG